MTYIHEDEVKSNVVCFPWRWKYVTLLKSKWFCKDLSYEMCEIMQWIFIFVFYLLFF